MKIEVENVSKYLLIAIILSLVVLAFSSYPSADDYSFFVSLKTTSLLDFCLHYYLTWSGRIISTFIFSIGQTAVNDAFKLKYFVIFFAFLFTLIPMAMLKILSVRKSVFYQLIATISLYFGLRRILGESVYWYTGAVVYSVPVFITFFWLYLMNNLRPRSTPQNNFFKALTCLVSFLVGNAFELTAIGFFVLWVYRVRKVKSLVADINFLAFILGFGLFVVSPGNLKRKIAQDAIAKLNSTAWVESFIKLVTLLAWPLLTIFILYLFFKLIAYFRSKNFSNFSRTPQFTLKEITIFSLFYMLPCLVSPRSVEGRTLFPLGVFWVFFGLDQMIKYSGNEALKITGLGKRIVLLISITSSTYLLYDIFNQNKLAASTQRYLVDRDSFMKGLKQDYSVDVVYPPYKEKMARLMPRSEAISDKDYWINQAISQYYKIKSYKTMPIEGF